MIHRPNLYYSKISKKKLKNEYTTSSGTGKNTTSQTASSTLHLEGQTRYFTVLERRKIELDKNKMDLTFIKSHQCSLERSQAVFWLKLILNCDQDLALSRQKQILTGLLVTKICKRRTMKIFLFNYSMLGYISPITTSLPHIYWRNSCPSHIFEPTHQTRLQASSHPGIFQTNLSLFGTFVDFYNQV